MDKVAAAASVRGQMVVVCYNYGLLTTNQLRYCLCTKTPQDLSGDNYMFTIYFRSIPKVLDSWTVQKSSVADGSASEALQTSCMVQGLCTVHGDVLLSMYCTRRCSPFCVLYMVTPHSHTCIKGS